MTKNITVTDEKGMIIGATYPKRARGLVKNGRALYVDDCTIRMSAKAEPSEDKSEGKHMNYILLNLREWSVCESGRGPQDYFSNGQVSSSHSFINDFNGGLVEVLQLGGWNIPYAEMLSRHYALTPDTEYSFVFWLNGGENDKSNEICQLRISFFASSGYSNIYKLNRSFIKPLLHYQGWELYSIPFRTPGGGSDVNSTVDTQFSFIAGNAPMAVKPAKEPEAYKDWEDMPDEFARQRPQRHNIVFEDGWPSIGMYGGDKYSTEVLRNGQNFKKEWRNEWNTNWNTNWNTGAAGFMTEDDEAVWENKMDALESNIERIQNNLNAVENTIETMIETIKEHLTNKAEAPQEAAQEE